MIKFETGKTYKTNFICSSDSWIHVTIIKRTEKTVTFEGVMGEGIKRAKIKVYEGVEQFLPTGSYSMAPTMRADKAA